MAYKTFTQSEAELAIAAHQYTIGSVGVDGAFYMADFPVFYTTREAAQAAASRLATENSKVTFVVLQATDGYRTRDISCAIHF